MIFHSLDYLLFLPVVVVLYFQLPPARRWILLLVASNIFYASWRLDFVPLLWVTTLVDYFAARAMPQASARGRRVLMGLSLCANLGLLLFFKYFMLVANSWMTLAYGAGGFEPYDILLPLGISFYTFQTLGYTIDVFRGRRPPERHFGYFAVYVMYFPQLIAGPIERPGRLLPQLRKEHRFDLNLAAAGGALMLVGYFKKLVIADNLANFVPGVMADPGAYSPAVVTIVSLGGLYQYYADISGYADIAIGSSMMLGIRLHRNFNRPFAAASIAEFWQRWHITVTTWFRDYLFLPLIRGTRARNARWRRLGAMLLAFTIIGLWHGASWQWLMIGLIAGAAMEAESAVRRNQTAIDVTNRAFGAVGLGRRHVQFAQALLGRAYLWIYLLITSILVTTAVTGGGTAVLERIAELPGQLAGLQLSLSGARAIPLVPVIAIAALEFYKWLDARAPMYDRIASKGRLVSWSFHYALAAAILIFGAFDHPSFIYFNF